MEEAEVVLSEEILHENEEEVPLQISENEVDLNQENFETGPVVYEEVVVETESDVQEMDIVVEETDPVVNTEDSNPIDDNEEEGEKEEKHEKEEDRQVEETPIEEEEISPEAVQKSNIQKEAFMEMFRIAPRVRDILPDLRVFMSHPDVIESDRKEIQQLVDIKIRSEKAKKKAEKAANKEKEQGAKEAGQGSLADVIRTATGLDLAGILAKAGKAPVPITSAPAVPVIMPGAAPVAVPIVETLNLAAPIVPVAVNFSAPPPIPMSLGTTPVQTIGRGKAGFATPHPNEVPVELRHVKPDLVAAIPDALRSIPEPVVKEVPAIPSALLHPDQQLPEVQKVFVRPVLRKTLYLAGARPGKRSERIKEELKELEKEKNKIRDKKDPLGALNRSLPSGVPPYPSLSETRGKRGALSRDSDREPKRTFTRPLALGLNQNSPIAVKRYHARQLSKETGMSLDEAMAEIEEQCKEFGVEETEEKRKADEEYVNNVKRRGDESWNSRHNYTPADHSKGIPGVDRPPSGYPRRDGPPKDGPPRDGPPREDRGRFPPRGGGIPGVDRPPGGGRYDREQDWDRNGGKGRRERRKRGGVKERERRMKREEFNRGGPPGRDRYDDWQAGPPNNKYGRYDEGGHGANQRGYDDYNSSGNTYNQEYTGYEDQGQHYEGYYEGQNYDQQYAEQGGDYDTNYDYYQGQAGQESSYYQEDGGQYYNEYYGTTDQTGYQASYAEPAASNPASSAPAPPES